MITASRLKNIWKSFTIWFNSVIASVVVALPMIKDQFHEMVDYLPADVYKYAMMVLVVGNILIRFKTNKDLADK